jgi:photosystem II stability/assembly factor-like uncharacterized protein
MKRIVAITGLVILLATQSDLSRAQWVQTNGPYGGTASEMERLGSKLIALADEGLFASNDSGASWQRLKNSPCDLFEMVMLGKTIVANGNPSFDPFFARSMDGGTSWILNYGTGIDGVYALSLVASGNCLYVIATDDVIPSPTTVEISTDTGQSWQAPWDSVGLYPKGRIQGLFTMNSVLFAESDSGIYRSSDSGKSWTDASGLMPKSATAFFIVDSELFAVTDSGLLRSQNGGTNWISAKDGLGNALVSNILEYGKVLLAWSDSGLYQSNDAGGFWSYTGRQPPHSYALFASDQTIFAGMADSGIWCSSDAGVSWKKVGLNCAVADHLAIVDSTIFVATQDASYHGCIFRSTDDGGSWSTAMDSTFAEYLFDPASFFTSVGKNLYAGGFNGDYDFTVSTDMGITWVPSGQNLNTRTVNVLVAHNDTLYVGTDSYGIFSSTDGGMNWRMLDSELFLFELNKNIDALAISGQNILAGTNDTGIFLSSDRGVSWVLSNNGISNPYINSFAQMGHYLFAGTSRGVYRSSDEGLDWTQENTGLAGALIGNFAVINRYIFGESYSGVFLSTDSGENWINVIGNLPDSSINELLLSNDNLYAATQEDGVWRRPLSDFGISAVSQTPPASLPQIQSYPNPFYSQATITFTNPNEGYAEVTIVNLLGAEVARLFTGELAAGEHSFVWDMPPGLPNGMYECVVNMDGQTQRVSLVHLQ